MIKVVLIGLCLIFAPYLVVMGLWEFITVGQGVWNIFKWTEGGRGLLIVGYALCLGVFFNIRQWT